MKSELIKISLVKANPNNPRTIKDDKFKKLVESIKAFPKMLERMAKADSSLEIKINGKPWTTQKTS